MPPADQPPHKPKPPRQSGQPHAKPSPVKPSRAKPSRASGSPGKKETDGKTPAHGKPLRRGKSSRSQKPFGRSGRSYSEASKWKPALLTLKKIGEGKFAFEAPPCALDRDLDLVEVHSMIAGAELEIARDELLYLVADCRGFLEAYCVLAELALEEGDIPLAKGHYGFAYENGLEALPLGFRGKLPAAEGYNSHFFKAGRGLARCLIAKGELAKGREVLEQLLKFDSGESETIDLVKQLDEREAEKKQSKAE